MGYHNILQVQCSAGVCLNLEGGGKSWQFSKFQGGGGGGRLRNSRIQVDEDLWEVNKFSGSRVMQPMSDNDIL